MARPTRGGSSCPVVRCGVEVVCRAESWVCDGGGERPMTRHLVVAVGIDGGGLCRGFLYVGKKNKAGASVSGAGLGYWMSARWLAVAAAEACGSRGPGNLSCTQRASRMSRGARRD